MTQFHSKASDLDSYVVKTLDDFGVITKTSEDMTDIGTILLYNCLELHGLYAPGISVPYHYKTFVYKPLEFTDGGAFYFDIEVAAPYRRVLKYCFPYDLWEHSLMSFALTHQVLFLAGPRPCFEGEALPQAAQKAGLDGVSSTIDALYASIDESIKAHGGLLVRIGPDTWNVVRILYMQNTLRGMVRRLDPSKLN